MEQKELKEEIQKILDQIDDEQLLRMIYHFIKSGRDEAER